MTQPILGPSPHTDRPITKLRLRILELGVQQYEIAAAAHMSPSRVSEYALGKRPIPPHHLRELCRVFECNPADILGFADVRAVS